MKGSFYIGKLSGIKIFIHWTFFFLLVWIFVSDARSGEPLGAIAYSLLFILAVFASITLHELGHALTARRFDVITQDITLLPIGGMARMDEMPEDPKQELAIALAGPAVNFIIAASLFPFVYFFGGVPTFFTLLFSSGSTFLFELMFVNILIGAFNLLPAFPMDGGRVFRALLAMKLGRVKATRIAARSGQFIAVIFFFVGLFTNPVLLIIGIFIFIMAQAENDAVRSRSMLHDYHVSDVLIRKFYTLDAWDTLEDAVEGLADVQVNDLLITEKGNVIGTLDKDALIKVLSDKGKDASVLFATNTKVTFLSPDTPLDQAVSSLQMNGTNILPVMQNGLVAGVADLRKIVDFLLMKAALAKEPAHVHRTPAHVPTAA
jgi:Zn-dependent protease/predicted transcriptional regulator